MTSDAIFIESSARVKRLPIWIGEASLVKLTGGRTNCNFAATDNSGIYFARYGIDLPHHFIFRINEQNAVTAASNAGVSPKLIYAHDGCLVTEFINGKGLEIEDKEHDETLVGIAKLLKKVHNTDTQHISNHFDVPSVINAYLKYMDNKLDSETLRIVTETLKDIPKLTATHLVHGDLIPNNFINDGKRLWLIDWEYAGLGHPAIDLAMVISNFELNAAQSKTLVDAHGMCELAEVMRLKPLLIARELMWTLVQIDKVGLEGDLSEYLELCMSRLKDSV